MDKTALEALVRQVLLERLGGGTHGVKAVQVPRIAVTESTGWTGEIPLDRVYTRDLFTLRGAARGWGGRHGDDRHHLSLDPALRRDGLRAQRTAGHPYRRRDRLRRAGELIYIPKNSSIQFSVTGHARFLYFVYPADWQSQGG